MWGQNLKVGMVIESSPRCLFIQKGMSSIQLICFPNFFKVIFGVRRLSTRGGPQFFQILTLMKSISCWILFNEIHLWDPCLMFLIGDKTKWAPRNWNNISICTAYSPQIQPIRYTTIEHERGAHFLAKEPFHEKQWPILKVRFYLENTAEQKNLRRNTIDWNTKISCKRRNLSAEFVYTKWGVVRQLLPSHLSGLISSMHQHKQR